MSKTLVFIICCICFICIGIIVYVVYKVESDIRLRIKRYEENRIDSINSIKMEDEL